MKLALIDDTPLICYQSEYFCRGAYIKFWQILAKHYDKVIICSPSKESEKVPKGYIPIGIENSFFWDLPYFSSARNFIRKSLIILPRIIVRIIRLMNECDAIWLRVPNSLGIIVFIVARIYSKPVIVQVAGDLRQTVLLRYHGIQKFLAYIATVVYLKIDKYIAKNSHLVLLAGEYLRDIYAGKATYIWSASLVKNIIIREKFETCIDPSKILYVGSLDQHKGISYLIKAVNYLRARGVQISLNMVGDGPIRGSLEQMIAKLRLSSFIKLHGTIITNIDKIYSENGLFVLPSLSEGIPKVLFEAMAAGLPIIATRVGGIPDIIKDGERGILVPPRSPEALANAIELLVKDKDLRQKLIKNGYDFVKEHTGEKKAMEVTDLIYKYIGQR